MTQLVIEREQAVELYPASPDPLKRIFENTFGKSVFITDIKERVKTVQDACVELGIDPSTVEKRQYETDNEHAYRCIKVVAKALNQGWEPDWKDSSEYKWYPWFDMSGSAPSFFGAADWRSGSNLGSRLCFKTEELASYAGKKFIKEYREYLVIAR